MNQSMTVREQVSALADGHLQSEDLALAIEAVCAQEDARGAWQAYHLVGDVLRSGVHSPCTGTDAFLTRFQQRLAAEPVVVRPAAVPVAPASSVPAVRRKADAANEPVFRWKLVAGAASLMAVAAIGWTLVGNGAAVQAPGAQLALTQPQSQPQTQSGTAAVLAPSRVLVGNGNGNAQVMLRDPRLDQLLEAHQQAGGATQMPSGFLRNATFEGPSR